MTAVLLCFYLYVGKWDRVKNAYQDAIASIRGVNRGNRNLAIAQEQRSNFKRKSNAPSNSVLKKPKPSSWTQRFYCLACTNDERVPTKTSMREMLKLAGLGEKKVQIPDVDCTTEEFHEALTNKKNCGGFELLRCIPSTRDLEVIQSPVCHSPRLLRSRTSSAKIFIRPIQADFDIDEVDQDDRVDVMNCSMMSRDSSC